MSYKRIIILSLLLITFFSSSVSATVIISPDNTFSFELPDNWKLEPEGFLIKSTNGELLTDIDLPTEGIKSIDQISQLAKIIVGMGLGYSPTKEKFDLKGNSWTGIAQVMNDTKSKVADRIVIQFIAQHNQQYKLFYLGLSKQQWQKNSEFYKDILKKLQFPISNKSSQSSSKKSLF
ncbi:MAG: hypothetical protein ACKE8R_02170 [Methylophagaceae bacterium]